MSKRLRPFVVAATNPAAQTLTSAEGRSCTALVKLWKGAFAAMFLLTSFVSYLYLLKCAACR